MEHSINSLERLDLKEKFKQETFFNSITELVNEAEKVIAPLWPISTFIARHPWEELEHLPFSKVANYFQQSFDINIYPDIQVFKRALQKGEIHKKFIEKRLNQWVMEQDLAVNRRFLKTLCENLLMAEDLPDKWYHSSTLGELARQLSGYTKIFSRGEFLPVSVHLQLGDRLNQQMIKWCKLFLDEKMGAWTLPLREKGFYAAWRELFQHDPTLSKEEKNHLSEWPKENKSAILLALSLLEIPKENIKNYLEGHLLQLPGWAGMLKWRSQQQEQFKDLLSDYLAIRLSLEWAMTASHLPFQKKLNTESSVLPLLAAWSHWGGLTEADWTKLQTDDILKCLQVADRFWRNTRFQILLEAWEETDELRLKQKIAGNSVKQSEQPVAQLLFCIDVRSEVLRRHLEASGPFETYGCAGFFGLPIKTRNLDSLYSHPSCPAIVKPKHEIYEIVSEKELSVYRRRRNMFLSIAETFRKIKKHTLASLFLPEMSGPWLGFYTITRSIAPLKGGNAISRIIKWGFNTPKVQFSLNRKKGVSSSGLPVGLTEEEKIQYVKQQLLNIGLTSTFSPLVVICGHESATTNNPYASSLDCGACGGAAGSFNAKVFAILCNEKNVREGLKKEGIFIPDETVFVAAEHITTTDELVWLDLPELTNSAKQSFQLLNKKLEEVRQKTNAERLEKLPHIAKYKNPKKEAILRSIDWSEIRPEWGLANNKAFIIGKRNLTKDCSLNGEVFLHSYDWEKDLSGEALGNIISGPATVGQWINLQYYASASNPEYYGSGNKTTQTITSGIGVMQGNGSDLLSGLPWQSIASSDDELFHAPLRLLLVIEAPDYYIERLLEQNNSFRQKVKNGWLRLSSIEPDTGEWITWKPSKVK
ncbi:DUF2309 domain-containing protein [Bacillus smithii]|uniref:DUF2309 domain-containing protein n=1 Tax=Bacillus smithii TaxID=1479 RepID=UPI0022E0883E|nr:DUF2309 domain-containing protein [Bacillus smithii]